MARDDYDVIVFKVLLYLYAVLKRKALFSAVNIIEKRIVRSAKSDIDVLLKRGDKISALVRKK